MPSPSISHVDSDGDGIGDNSDFADAGEWLSSTVSRGRRVYHGSTTNLGHALVKGVFVANDWDNDGTVNADRFGHRRRWR